MEKHDKAWALYVFSSANVLRSYTHRPTRRAWASPGSGWAWKARTANTRSSAASTPSRWSASCNRTASACSARRSSGWRTTRPRTSTRRSSTPSRHDTDFHQFMLYTPIPGTPLHCRAARPRALMKDARIASRPTFTGSRSSIIRHPHISDGQEGEFMLRAFERDFEVNGPSIVRIVRTHAGRLEAIQEPSRRADPPPLRLGSPGLCRRPSRRWSGPARRSTTATIPRCDAKMSRFSDELHAEFGWNRGLPRRRRSATSTGSFAARRSDLRQRLDLRAADLLREELARRPRNGCPGRRHCGQHHLPRRTQDATRRFGSLWMRGNRRAGALRSSRDATREFWREFPRTAGWVEMSRVCGSRAASCVCRSWRSPEPGCSRR